MSQQSFAVAELKSALNTVGRYETTNPPTGDALLRLAEIAKRRNLPKIAVRFHKLWFEEVMQGRANTLSIDAEAGTGWLIMKLAGREQIDAAIDYFEAGRTSPVDAEWIDWKKSVGYKGKKRQAK